MHSDDRGPVRARVRCAPCPLLRPLTLRCTRRRGAADDPTWSPADPGAFPVKSSLREMGSRGLSSCGLCRAGLASREPRRISASRPGITGTDFGRAPGAVAHPGREGASLGRIWSGRAFGSSAGHLGRPTSSTHPSSRAPRSVSTSLNPRARLLEVRARGLSDVLAGYPAISRAAVLQAPGRRPDAVRPGHESRASPASHRTQIPASAEPAQHLRLPDDRLVSDSRPREARPGREMALREDRSAPHPMIASREPRNHAEIFERL